MPDLLKTFTSASFPSRLDPSANEQLTPWHSITASSASRRSYLKPSSADIFRRGRNC